MAGNGAQIKMASCHSRARLRSFTLRCMQWKWYYLTDCDTFICIVNCLWIFLMEKMQSLCFSYFDMWFLVWCAKYLELRLSVTSDICFHLYHIHIQHFACLSKLQRNTIQIPFIARIKYYRQQSLPDYLEAGRAYWADRADFSYSVWYWS